MFGSGSGSGTSTTSTYSGSGSSSGGGYTPAAAPAYVPPPISKALDEKNGFKDFHFGMTVNEVRAVLEPTRVSRNEGANTDTLFYSGTAVNRIGEFATDSLGLQFLREDCSALIFAFRAFRTRFYEALKINYGEPFDNSSWTRARKL